MIVNLDLLKYAVDLQNLKEIANDANYTFVKGDVCNKELIQSLFKKYNFSEVIHFAVESHVYNSIKNRGAFVRTNVIGTFNLLDVAKNYLKEFPNRFKKNFKNLRFYPISPDEVSGTLGDEYLFTEEVSYASNSYYSASKSSLGFMVRSCFYTSGMNAITTNCSNNYGLKQHDEKLIPTIIRKAISEENISIYSTRKNFRDRLCILDHSKGVD
jgi:dTDP-glucose 4,6-dehydratase